MLLDHSGVEIARHVGTRSEVSFSHFELFRAAGGVFTHNHPDGTGPSVADVQIAAHYDIAEMRVVTRTHRYIVTRLDRNKVATLQAEYDAEMARVEPLLRDKVRCGQLSPSDFPAELVHVA